MPVFSTSTQRIYKGIREKISSHQLKPGARIVEEEMAKEIGASRTPVREALNRLEMEGLIEIVPKWGTYVKKIEFEEIMEIYELREFLEGMAARIAASRIGEEQLEELRRVCAECDRLGKSGDLEARRRMDKQFHELVVKVAQHKKLQKIVDLFSIQIESFRISNTVPFMEHIVREVPTQESTAEHMAIIGALSERDADGAEAAARKHMRSAKERIEREYRLSREGLAKGGESA